MACVTGSRAGGGTSANVTDAPLSVLVMVQSTESSPTLKLYSYSTARPAMFGSRLGSPAWKYFVGSVAGGPVRKNCSGTCTSPQSGSGIDVIDPALVYARASASVS